jgi:tetratricopeptide (TPR) repeat protein
MRFWFAAAAVTLALTACAKPDPLAQAKADCADAGKQASVQISACTTVLDSGTLDAANRAIALANRGSAQRASGEVTDALRDFNAALQLNGDNMQAVLGRASVLIDSGQLDAAEPLVQRLLASGEFAANAQYLAGDLALRQGDADTAITAFDRAINSDGSYAQALAGRGRAKQMNQDYEGAVADYTAAVAIDPHLSAAYAGRCWSRVLRHDQDLAPARADADAAVNADAANTDAQLCRGLLQLRNGEWADAKVSYNAVLNSEPGNPRALFGRGVARRRSGDSAGIQDMNKARDFSRNIDRTFAELGVPTF